MPDSISILIKKFTIYLCSILFASLVFIAFFWTNLFIEKEGLFFRAALLVLITSACLLISLLIMRWRKMFGVQFLYLQDIFLIVLLFVFLNWQIYGLVPFNSTRSNSIILLDYMYLKNGSPATSEEIETYIKDIYFGEYRSVSIRLGEQLDAGNLIKTEDGWVITEKGKKIAEYLSRITNLYNPKKSYFKNVK